MAPYLGCRGADTPGWFDVSPKNSAPDVMHKPEHCRDEAANHQLPIAAASWIIWIVSVEKCSSLRQNLMQICCSTCSFWMRQPHSAHAYQWCLRPPLTNTAKSSVFTHANSSPLSLAARLHRCPTNHSRYINHDWTFSGQTSYIYCRIVIPIIYIFHFKLYETDSRNSYFQSVLYLCMHKI